MPHLHQEPGQHDLTTSAYIIRTDGPEPTIMLHEHRKLGTLLQFGGHVELDETPWQGLLRELAEEVGYDASQLSVLQPPQRFSLQSANSVGHPLPFSFNTHRFNAVLDHFHSDVCYAVIAQDTPRHAIAAGESAAIHRFTLAQLEALAPDDIFDHTRASARHVLTQLYDSWEPISASSWPA